MSMAPLDAKWRMASRRRPGQAALGQKCIASPSSRTTGVPQTGHFAGMRQRRSRPERFSGTGPTPTVSGLYRPGIPFRVLSEEAERTILEEALVHHNGQMAATARGLGLERSHLYKKAKALGLRGGEGGEEE